MVYYITILKGLWVVTKIAIPKLEDIHFPDINFDPDCKFVRKLKNATQAAQYEIQSICKSMKPLISLLKQKERHYKNAIKALLKEEIPRSLHESGHSQSSRSNQVPVSAGQEIFVTLEKERCQSQYARREQHLL